MHALSSMMYFLGISKSAIFDYVMVVLEQTIQIVVEKLPIPGILKETVFFEDDERMFFLKEAVDSLLAMHNRKVIKRIDNCDR